MERERSPDVSHFTHQTIVPVSQDFLMGRMIMRFAIPVVFYEITIAECVYSSNTTIFIGRIYSISYIGYNYMFRRLIMAIFRLYMKYLLSSYTKHTWTVYMG